MVQEHAGFKVMGPIEDAADAGAAGEALLSAGAGVPPVWGAAPGATKEIFAAPFYGIAMTGLGADIDGAGDQANMAIIVPQDFTSITALEVIFLPAETGASMNFLIITKYAAYHEEAYDTHTETADPRNIGATVMNQNLAHDISDLVDVAALAAGDFLFVHVAYDAAVIDSGAYVRGLRLKYN